MELKGGGAAAAANFSGLLSDFIMSRPDTVPVSVARGCAWLAGLKEDCFGALCSCVPGCGRPVRVERSQVAWFPQMASGFGFTHIDSQISPAVNVSVAAPPNHLLKAKMEMFKIHVWTSVMLKAFRRKAKHGGLLRRT